MSCPRARKSCGALEVLSAKCFSALITISPPLYFSCTCGLTFLPEISAAVSKCASNPMTGEFFPELDGISAVTMPVFATCTFWAPFFFSSLASSLANFNCPGVLGTEEEVSLDCVSNVTYLVKRSVNCFLMGVLS